jgi:putative ABC transport system permease protein
MRFRDRMLALAEGVGIALEALRANKVRAALTILGIAIGVFVVVVMSAAIHGVNLSVAAEFEKAGPTTFYVNRFPITLEGCSDADDESCTWRRNPPLKLHEAEALRRLSTVQDVTVATGASVSVKYFDRELPSAQASAYTANWIEVNGGDIVQGRNFTPAEETNGARVVVVNQKMVERLIGEVDPIGKTIAINRSPFLVIGVYEGGGDFMSEPRPRVYVPFEAGRRYLNLWIDWIDFTVRPRAGVSRDEAVDDVVATMRGLRSLRPGDTENFAIITQDKLFETWGRMTGIFFLVMILLSGVGLLVGGVGVVAIMMISVTERTREIGVRKALGATRGIILWQFLIEAATLTAIGAILGLTVGWLLALLVRSVSPLQMSVQPVAIAVAFLASAFTGVLFGLLPASKAARLDPIDALRYE